MSDEVNAADQHQDIGHEIGEHNIQTFGLDIHNPVFAISALLAITLVIGTLLFQEAATLLFGEMRVWITTTFDWFFMVSANLFAILCFAVAFSKLGRVRLGGTGARPQYTDPAWLAMLFAAGVGIGLMFFGVLEPVTHTLTPPLGIDPEDSATARAAGMSSAIFHWGLHAWAIYAVVGLSLAFFSFNQGMPLTLRSAFYPLFGKAVWGPLGHLIDVLAVLATLFGLATSLGIGAGQIAGGLNYLFDLPAGITTKIILIALIISVALGSVVAGLDKGVKRLSELNLVLAAALLLFVLLAGPTIVILKGTVQATIDYAYYLPQLSNWVGRSDFAFLHGWTTFYWAWWIAWSPFVGMFIARVSYGRTVREFIVWVLIVPTIICILWMSTFGGTALDQLINAGTRVIQDAGRLASHHTGVGHQHFSYWPFLRHIRRLRLACCRHDYGGREDGCASETTGVLVCTHRTGCYRTIARWWNCVFAGIDYLGRSTVLCRSACYVRWIGEGIIRGANLKVTV